MARKIANISLVLGWNERYDHKIAVGIIKFSHQRKDWRLSGNEWLFRHKGPLGQKADGIIARITNREEHERLLSLGMPVVDIANAYADSDLPRALNDDVMTGSLAAGHFLDKGYPHLGYVGINETSWSNMRMAGMRAAIAGHSDPELYCYNVGLSWLKREPSLAGLAGWLGRIPRPCGILAANDILGYRVTIAAAMAGIRIPDQVGVVGVDNEDVFCELSNPTLTSISCDCETIGLEAASLLARILSGDRSNLHVVVPPLGIAERESTDLRFGRDPVVIAAKKFIYANAAKGINVNDVVAACSLSRRALERRFVKTEGRSLHDAILDVRLENARSLLASGKSASEAGYGSGFRTVQHFHYSFRKQFGMTPMEYAASLDDALDG